MHESIEVGLNHKRIITITLAMLDEFLCECDLWARGRQVQSVLYRESNSLTAEQRERLAQSVESLRAELTEVRETLGLETKAQEASDSIRAACYLLWESLVEIQGKYLRGYGEPPAKLVSYLDPKSMDMIALIQDIIETVRRPVRNPQDTG